MCKKQSSRCGQTKKYEKGKMHGEESGCLNTVKCCVFQYPNVSNNTTGVNSRRCSKGIFKIIHFLKTTEEKKPFRECFE